MLFDECDELLLKQAITIFLPFPNIRFTESKRKSSNQWQGGSRQFLEKADNGEQMRQQVKTDIRIEDVKSVSVCLLVQGQRQERNASTSSRQHQVLDSSSPQKLGYSSSLLSINTIKSRKQCVSSKSRKLSESRDMLQCLGSLIACVSQISRVKDGI